MTVQGNRVLVQHGTKQGDASLLPLPPPPQLWGRTGDETEGWMKGGGMRGRWGGVKHGEGMKLRRDK